MCVGMARAWPGRVHSLGIIWDIRAVRMRPATQAPTRRKRRRRRGGGAVGRDGGGTAAGQGGGGAAGQRGGGSVAATGAEGWSSGELG